MKRILGATVALAMLAIYISQAQAGVLKTGQTTSFTTGDDGFYQAGAPVPSPRFTDIGDGTVTDNLTGLTWLKDAGCLGQQNWADALGAANTLADGNVACGLTDGSVAGDWRLPNRNELTSLLDLGTFSPALPAGHPFTNFVAGRYWSSTTEAGFSDLAWLVDLDKGGVGNGDKLEIDFFYFVTAVRGGLSGGVVLKTGQTTSFATGDDGFYQAGAPVPSPRFTDIGDGTVTDNLTGLTWLKDAGCLGRQNWADALGAANTLADGDLACGLTDGSVTGDWRLPNRNELTSLLDLGTFSPALPAGHPFTNFVDNRYWSSTTHAFNTNQAWIVLFHDGNVDAFVKFVDVTWFVTAVRGGL
jgi:hypothetical protein